MPTVSIPAFTVALSEFANFAGIDEQHHVWLLLDNASWHRSPKVQRPSGLDFRFLPAYSPELQPAEHLWQLTDTPLANRCFATLDELEQTLVEHCRWLQLQLDSVRSATCFSWWPTAA
jgi:transposase